MLGWKGPVGIIEPNSWPCAGRPKNPTVCLRTLSKLFLNSDRLWCCDHFSHPGVWGCRPGLRAGAVELGGHGPAPAPGQMPPLPEALGTLQGWTCTPGPVLVLNAATM